VRRGCIRPPATCIHATGTTSTTAAKTLPGAALLAGGILAGIILGIAIALGIGQADPRIRSTGDLKAAGVRALAVDPSKPDSVEALRALAEVGGVDAKGGVVAVVTPKGDHGGGLSRTLAESFAQSRTADHVAVGERHRPLRRRRLDAGRRGHGGAVIAAAAARRARGLARGRGRGGRRTGAARSTPPGWCRRPWRP
jgi:hypothetical protein